MLMYWQVALRIVREGSSDESLISGEVVQLQPAEAGAEAVDESDEQAAANKTGIEVESVGNSSHEHKSETSIQVDSVLTSDHSKDSKVFLKLIHLKKKMVLELGILVFRKEAYQVNHTLC